MPQMMTTKDKIATVRQLVERQLPEIRRAVPRGIDPQRFARVALTTFQNVPALLDCTPASLLGAVMQAAAWGLELDPVLGMAYLIPYREKCQLIIGYQGLIELARRSGDVRNVIARAVYANDKFEYRYGTTEVCIHEPFRGAERGELAFVYAVASLATGEKVFDVMDMHEVERHRDRSMAKNSGPWKTDYEAMAKKTVVRRLCKFLPRSVELGQALQLDEQADRAEQDLGTIIEVEQAPTGKPASLDQLAATLPEPEPVAVPAAAPPAPAPAPRPVAHDPRPSPPPAPTARDEARATQAAAHERPRAHREPGEEG
jgi:recombination protein RecT